MKNIHVNALAPIVLTKMGERLVFNSDIPAEEKSLLGSVEMMHQECGGAFSVGKVSEKFRVLFCPRCGLRIYVPIMIKTVATLRSHMAGAF